MSTRQHMRGPFAMMLEWQLRYFAGWDGHRLESPQKLPEHTAACTKEPSCCNQEGFAVGCYMLTSAGACPSATNDAYQLALGMPLNSWERVKMHFNTPSTSCTFPRGIRMVYGARRACRADVATSAFPKQQMRFDPRVTPTGSHSYRDLNRTPSLCTE